MASKEREEEINIVLNLISGILENYRLRLEINDHKGKQFLVITDTDNDKHYAIKVGDKNEH